MGGGRVSEMLFAWLPDLLPHLAVFALIASWAALCVMVHVAVEEGLNKDNVIEYPRDAGIVKGQGDERES